MKKVGKTTRPFRYDLNQIPFDSTVEVTNRFRGLDLVDRVPVQCHGQRFITLYRRPLGIKTIYKKKKCKKVKWLFEEAVQINSCEKKRSKRHRRKEKVYPFECRVPKNSRERKER